MIIDRIRNLEEFKTLYESRPMPRQYDFDFLVGNPNLFCFYDEITGRLRGYITVQIEDGELTLSGASVRKNMSDNINAIISVCNAFDEPIYSYTEKKEAAMVLKKAGFVKLNKETYVRLKNGKKIISQV